MTGRAHFTPEARQQLHQLDEWISEKASPETARQFVAAILDHIDGILAFPHAGPARDDIRAGVRTTTFKKRTLVAYVIDESHDEVMVTVLGVFHGGQNWEVALSEDRDRNNR